MNTVDEAQDSKQMFLKLLVAQIQNQNPLSPQDPTEFLGQLTQYSMLEQLIMIRQGVAPDALTGENATGGDPGGDTTEEEPPKTPAS
jgi:flagellar basal-body rod modification protein FlgD